MNQHSFNWPLFVIWVVVVVVPMSLGHLALALSRHARKARPLVLVTTRPKLAELKFTTHDYGRTWSDSDGWKLQASPFTDGLQDQFDARYLKKEVVQ